MGASKLHYSITVVARVFPYGIVGERLRDVDASGVDQEINAATLFLDITNRKPVCFADQT